MAGSIGYTLEALVIYDSRLFNRTGHVREWAERLERRFVANSKQAAPKRTGLLAGSIWGVVNRVGPVHLETLIHSDAPYSLFVLKGTTGPIMANRLYRFQGRTGIEFPRGGRRYVNGRFVPEMGFLKANNYLLKVRAGNGFPQTYRISVSGQEANNFFADAATATARRHSSLRGFDPGYGF